MPRRYKKKQPLKKRLVKAGKYAWKHRSTAVKALALASKVARMVNVEYKWAPITLNQNADSGGFIYNICQPIEFGDTSTTREGDSIKLMRFSGRGFITQNSSAQKTAVRVILFYSKQDNGHQYVVPDILDDVNYSAGTSLFLAPKNHTLRYNTKIFYDKTYHMSNNGNSSIIFDYNFKLFGHTNYIQGQEGTGSVQDHGIHILVISNEDTNYPHFNFRGKLTFTDN